MRAVAALFVLGCILGSESWADRGGFFISNFDVTLRVMANSDLEVEERITVHFTERRHGIYRTIPVRYTDPSGYLYGLDLRLRDVRDEHGEKYQVKRSRSGRDLHFRIGDPDRTVEGRVVYVIRYRVRDALRHFPEHDELYWNATGHNWRTRIETSSATVVLPAAVAVDSMELAAFAGLYGAREANVQISSLRQGEVEYRVEGALRALEGLTIVCSFPHGVVRFPGPFQRFLRFATMNWIILVPFAFLAFLLRSYHKAGRDPEFRSSVMVEYEPPKNVSPASLGTIIDERVNMRDLTATIVDLAIRGYLTIRTTEKEHLWGIIKKDVTVFERRLEKSDATLLPHEARILQGIFENKPQVSSDDLEQKFYRKIPGIKNAVYSLLVSRGWFHNDPQSVRQSYMGYGFLAGIITVAAGTLWGTSQGGIMPQALILPLISGVLTAILFFAFSPAMPKRTHAGVRIQQWGLGFEEFVGRVEADRLEREAARNVFEKLLPYAMALGVANRWAERFEGIYRDRGPEWYVGPQLHGGSISTRSFEGNLSDAMSRASRSMASAPRSSGSSGSGGGGFSGGGGGGGGGGSW